MKLVKPMGWRPNRCLKTCQVELAGGVDSLWKLPRGMNAGRGVKKALARFERRRGCILYWGINAEAFLN